MKYLVCNLKENKNAIEMQKYNQDLKELDYKDDLKLILCPSMPFLNTLTYSKIELGSQDVSKYNGGAYTGEVSAEQLSSIGVKYVLIGHSERKKYFNENEKDFLTKIKNCLEQNLSVIYFIGEISKETKQENIYNKINSQLQYLFNNISSKYYKKIIIAYEPSWSIGTGSIPEITNLEKILKFIKEKINFYTLNNLPLLYGGGVNQNNLEELFALSALDGFVIGECSLDVNSLKKIYNNYE